MILVIVGPTAVGKTKLSIALAKIYNGEIINADAMQIYRGLDIGTAKVTKQEMDHIPHHLLSIKEVTEDYSVYDYQKDARAMIREIQSRGKIPILVGGTGYYIKAALYDYRFSEEEQKEISYPQYSDEELVSKIEEYEMGIVIDLKNRRRNERLLAKLEEGSFFLQDDFQCCYDDVFFIGLTAPREILYERINHRLAEMVVDLIDEVKPYFLAGLRSKALMTGIGYKELYDFFENQKTLREVVLQIKQNSRHYAKRQFTWFQNQMDVQWFSVCYENFKLTIQEVIDWIEKTEHR